MRLISMRIFRASDNSDIHLECLLPLFFDRLRIRINTVYIYSYIISILQQYFQVNKMWPKYLSYIFISTKPVRYVTSESKQRT